MSETAIAADGIAEEDRMAVDGQDWNQRVIEEFRANQGKVGGPLAGAPLLLLHHRGARTGIERVNPVSYQKVKGGYAVFGLRHAPGEAPTNPDWYYNLLANPEASVEVGIETIPVRVRLAQGEERERIWEQQKRANSVFADYERNATRQIPVVILEPRG
jgi:deazaflavin-dependent oxidoreductase (nitroreductase family)